MWELHPRNLEKNRILNKHTLRYHTQFFITITQIDQIKYNFGYKPLTLGVLL
jgi:hypothetical protein